jgi:hypothetical protein
MKMNGKYRLRRMFALFFVLCVLYGSVVSLCPSAAANTQNLGLILPFYDQYGPSHALDVDMAIIDALFGPSGFPGPVKLAAYAVATLPLPTNPDMYVTVIDGVSASDCTTGGASGGSAYRVMCRSTGSVWEAVGGGSSFTLTAANFGSFTAGLTAKTTPVGADIVPLSDSAAGGAEKGLSWTNLLAGILSYIQGGSLNLGSNSLSAGQVNIGTAALFTPMTVTYASTTNINFNSGEYQYLTLTGSPTITFTAPANSLGGTVKLFIIQGGSGSYTITWPTDGTGMKWINGVTTLQTAIGAVDVIVITYAPSVGYIAQGGNAQ